MLAIAGAARVLHAADAQFSDARLPPVLVTAPTSVMPVTSITRDDVVDSGAITADDALRQVAGFSTFRRSSSLVTPPAEDPEAQGVTLRGVGPGGASRALVLLDGIPMNDPFGGWLYWNEMPLEDVQSVQIAPGASSTSWGNYALSGIVDVRTRPLEESRPVAARTLFSGGTRGTTNDDVSVDAANGPLRARIGGGVLRTDGWSIVTQSERGPIDENAGLLARRANLQLEHHFDESQGIFLRGLYYDESRDGGTPLRTADVQRGFVAGGGNVSDGYGGELSLKLFSHVSRLEQTFSDVFAGRTRESLSQRQRIPSVDGGGAFEWSRQVLDAYAIEHDVVAGSDVRIVSGTSDDRFFATAAGQDQNVERPQARRSSGKQAFAGVFVEDTMRVTNRLRASLGLRLDWFESFDAHVATTVDDHDHRDARPETRAHVAESPRLALAYDVVPDRLTLRAAGYRTFRAPTLAELYRQSAVEELVLRGNPRLRPEVLNGGEAGVDCRPFDRVETRITGYWNDVHDAISAITTRVDPDTGEDAERSRTNLGLARVRGVDVAVNVTIRDALAVGGTYLYADARVVDAPDPDLEGKRLTQVPMHSGSVWLRWSDIEWHGVRLATAVVRVRAEGLAYEDPDNHDRLPSYAVVDLHVSHDVGQWIGGFGRPTVFVGVQNLFDRRYVVDRGGGVLKTGTPRLIEAGARLTF